MSQFHYHKKRLRKTNSTTAIFHEIPLNTEKDNINQVTKVFKEIKITNRQMNKLKILHFDEGLWLYYHCLEANSFKWPTTSEEALKVNIDELRWLLKGYEVRTKSKFKTIKQTNYY